jgi:hypothetical protein
LTRVSAEKISEAKAQDRARKEKKLPRKAEFNIWEDACIIIGFEKTTRTAGGDGQKSKKVPLKDFRNWLKITVDIQPPKDVISTSEGDLILDPKFKNKIYLHGLVLPEGSRSGKPYRYGYNFVNVKTGRDRRTLASQSEEAMAVTKIWAAALEDKKISLKHSLVGKYGDMLLIKSAKAPADVLDVHHHISENLWRMVWSYVKGYVVEAGRNTFFYNWHNDVSDLKILERITDL